LRLRTLAPALALPLAVGAAATAAGLHAHFSSSPMASGGPSQTLHPQLPVAITAAPQSPVQPSPRSGAAFAWDAAHHVDLLYGGAGAQGTLSDTWTWDGATWRQLHPATSPPAMKDAAAAWDADRGRTVLLGRSDFDPTTQAMPLNVNLDLQTWTWTGATWARDLDAGIATEGFEGTPVLVDDARDHRLLALAAIRPHSGDTTLYTYAWDAGRWRLLDESLALDTTTFGAAWDSATGTVRLVQTYPAGTKPEHVWTWQGNSWHAEPDGPAASSATLLTNPTSPGLVQPDLTATHVWDGHHWTAHRSPSLNLVTGIAAAPDFDRHTPVLFGGRTATRGATALSDRTWTWDGDGWSLRGGGPFQVVVPRTPPAALDVPACPSQREPLPTAFTRSGDALDVDITLPAPAPGCTAHSVEVAIVDDNGTPLQISGDPVVVKTSASHIRVRWQNWCGGGSTYLGIGLDHNSASSEIVRPPSCGDKSRPSTLRLLS
jgi:hypothetical protein